MLILEKDLIGKNLYKYRKKAGLTQIEVSEKANLSDKTYADIERGTANMRVDTLIKICKVLNITPNDILYKKDLNSNDDTNTLISKIESCSEKDREFILNTLSSFLNTR